MYIEGQEMQKWAAVTGAGVPNKSNPHWSSCQMELAYASQSGTVLQQSPVHLAARTYPVRLSIPIHLQIMTLLRLLPPVMHSHCQIPTSCRQTVPWQEQAAQSLVLLCLAMFHNMLANIRWLERGAMCCLNLQVFCQLDSLAQSSICTLMTQRHV